MAGRDYDEGARVLKALAHPTRLHLLELIREKSPCVKSMEKVLGVTQPNVSQHLSLLRNMGIIEAKRDGNQVCYHIKNQIASRLFDVLMD